MAYGWTKAAWHRVQEGEDGDGGEGEHPNGGHDERQRGWVEGDSRDVCYRGRLGSAYQADICSEAEVGGEAEDRSTRVAVADLWKETRLGEPGGEAWEAGMGLGRQEIQRQDEEGRVGTGREEAGEAAMTEGEEGGGEARWRGGRRARPSDAQGRGCGAQEAQGGGGGEGERGRGRGEEEEEETGVGEGGEWLEGDWVTPKTVEGLNELWEEQGLAGWWRGQEPEGWSKDGDRVYGGLGAGDKCNTGNTCTYRGQELGRDTDARPADGQSSDSDTGPSPNPTCRPRHGASPIPKGAQGRRGARQATQKRRRGSTRAADDADRPAAKRRVTDEPEEGNRDRRSHGRTGTGGEASASASTAAYEGTAGRRDAGSGAQVAREQRRGHGVRQGGAGQGMRECRARRGGGDTRRRVRTVGGGGASSANLRWAQ